MTNKIFERERESILSKKKRGLWQSHNFQTSTKGVSRLESEGAFNG